MGVAASGSASLVTLGRLAPYSANAGFATDLRISMYSRHSCGMVSKVGRYMNVFKTANITAFAKKPAEGASTVSY